MSHLSKKLEVRPSYCWRKI